MNEPTPLPTVTITPTPTIVQLYKSPQSSVLGASTDRSPYDSYETVRPTQYYERPSIVEETSLENNLKNNKSELESSSNNHTVKVVKTSALLSVLASFLTAGFIFIRIIL